MNIVTGYIGADGGTVKINGYDIFAQPEEAKNVSDTCRRYHRFMWI